MRVSECVSCVMACVRIVISIAYVCVCWCVSGCFSVGFWMCAPVSLRACFWLQCFGLLFDSSRIAGSIPRRPGLGLSKRKGGSAQGASISAAQPICPKPFGSPVVSAFLPKFVNKVLLKKLTFCSVVFFATQCFHGRIFTPALQKD